MIYEQLLSFKSSAIFQKDNTIMKLNSCHKNKRPVAEWLVLPTSDQGPHCLPVCKNRFEKFARIFSRRHKQTTFSDEVFLGVLRVKRAGQRKFMLI